MKTTYKYTARTKEGSEVKGKVLANDKADAFDYLTEQEYTDIDIRRHFEVDELY